MPEDARETAAAEEKAPREICSTCHNPHVKGKDCLQSQQEYIAQLVLRVGNIDRCKGCNATIYWIRHLNGNHGPYTSRGVIHFIDCPEAETFRRSMGGRGGSR